MTQGNKTAGVVGLGFMGASLAAALRRTGDFERVVGYDSEPDAAGRALDAGLVDEVAASAAALAADADLLVLCTPVQRIIIYLTELGEVLRPGTVVLDIGSTKHAVTAAMDQLLPEGVIPLGGHPMTGPATAGVTEPDAVVYDGRVFLLTPTPRTDPAALHWCTGLLERIGARVEVLDPERHDRLVAVVSHLPRMLPVPLLALAADDPDPLLTRLPAGGFRESTRKATESLDMWVDVLVTNSGYVASTLREYARAVEVVADQVADGDEAALRALLTDAAQRWRSLFEQP
ncbi:prephenate dehydrogenase [Promicromonospora sp. MS192]|uniref:prephenate dehydrogenase n=1 Tax=Promicromonospora sp. MS192 TaxID=3412684 RepID=UPI003C2DB6D9